MPAAENIKTAFETFKASVLTEFTATPDAAMAAPTWRDLTALGELLVLLGRYLPSEPRTRSLVSAALAPE